MIAFFVTNAEMFGTATIVTNLPVPNATKYITVMSSKKTRVLIVMIWLRCEGQCVGG